MTIISEGAGGRHLYDDVSAGVQRGWKRSCGGAKCQFAYSGARVRCFTSRSAATHQSELRIRRGSVRCEHLQSGPVSHRVSLVRPTRWGSSGCHAVRFPIFGGWRPSLTGVATCGRPGALTPPNTAATRDAEPIEPIISSAQGDIRPQERIDDMSSYLPLPALSSVPTAYLGAQYGAGPGLSRAPVLGTPWLSRFSSTIVGTYGCGCKWESAIAKWIRQRDAERAAGEALLTWPAEDTERRAWCTQLSLKTPHM